MINIDKHAWTWIFILALLASVVSILTVPNPINQSGRLDPWFYTALIQNYGDVVERYGATYYSFRTSAIFFIKAFYVTFGDYYGYVIARVMLLFCACVAGAVIAMRFYGAAVAAAAVAWIAFNPWLLRALMTDHVYGVATVYSMIAAGILFGTVRRPIVSHFASGLALGSMASANPFSVIVFVSFVPLWFLVQPNLNLRSSIARIGALAAGFAAALSSWIGVQAAFLHGDLWAGLSTTWEMSVLMTLEGGASRWLSPLWPALRKGDYLMLVPPMIAGFLLLLTTRADMAKADRKFLMGALASTLMGIGIYLFFQVILGVSVITWVDYSVLLFPVACVGVIAILGETSMTLSQQQRVAALFSFAVVHFGIWLFLPTARSLVTAKGPWLLIPPLLLLVTYAAFRMRPKIATVLGAAFVLMLPLPISDNEILSADQRAWERSLYDGALALQKFITIEVPPSQGTIGFWYKNLPEKSDLDSLQSMFLWGYSRLAEGSDPGMPVVSQSLRSRLAHFRYIALLAWTWDEVQDGLNALRNAGVRYTPVSNLRFEEGPVHFEVQLIELSKAVEPPD